VEATFLDNIMLCLVGIDQVCDFGLIRSKIILIYRRIWH